MITQTIHPTISENKNIVDDSPTHQSFSSTEQSNTYQAQERNNGAVSKGAWHNFGICLLLLIVLLISSAFSLSITHSSLATTTNPYPASPDSVFKRDITLSSLTNSNGSCSSDAITLIDNTSNVLVELVNELHANKVVASYNEEVNNTAENDGTQDSIEDTITADTLDNNINSEPVLYPGSVFFLGTTKNIIDCHNATVAPEYDVGVWKGSLSVSDNGLGVLAGHNPGIFYNLVWLSVGDIVSVCDYAGDVCEYVVTSVIDAPSNYLFDEISGDVYYDDAVNIYYSNSNSGEQIILLCCNGDGFRRLVYAQGISNS